MGQSALGWLFIGADVASSTAVAIAIGKALVAALISRAHGTAVARGRVGIAGVDCQAACQEGMGRGRATIILQRTQVGVRMCDVTDGR